MSYISQKTRANPSSMALAIGLNGAIIIGVMLSPMIVEIMPSRPPTTAENVEITLPPPPDAPKDQAVETPALDPAYRPAPMIDTEITKFDPMTIMDKPFEGAIIALNGTTEDFHELVKRVDPPKPIFKAAIRDPRFAKSFQPDFPVGLLQREIEGSAKVKVLIGIDGRVRQVIVLSASDAEFGRATEKKALSSWRFMPATRGGEPVEDWQILTVRFDIN